ncbi:MAG: hypothetical protein DWQ10_06795 [Calditrichaeota bacterium]|nr:MAG: hypothetical protein DWQ10_06795 [Calditrichota bacterium]
MTKRKLTYSLFFLLAFTGKSFAQSSDQVMENKLPLSEILAGTDSVSIEKFIIWQTALDTMIWRYHQQNSLLIFNRITDARHNEFRLTPLEKQEMQIDRDYVGANLSHDQLDNPPLLSISGLTRLGANAIRAYKNKPKKVSELPIPTELEIDILNIIWQNERATGRDIYAKLDSTHIVTFIQLREKLHHMARTGFLNKRIISPQNPFTFMTPIGDYSIEMSPKNRRNREFEYRSLVARGDMFDYLSSKMYQSKDKKSSEGRGEKALRDLLLRMISVSQ